MRDGGSPVLMKMLKNIQLKYGQGIILLRNQKEGTAGILIHLKCKNNVRLVSFIVENAKIRKRMVRLGSYIVEKAKIKYG